MPKVFPRSPYARLAGYVHLPRLIDKARLHRQGLLEGYNYKTVGFDKQLLSYLEIDPDTFEETVHRLQNDEAIVVWLQQNSRPHPAAEIEAWNQTLIQRGPDSTENIARFKFQLREVGGDTHPEVRTYFDLIELEEGRL